MLLERIKLNINNTNEVENNHNTNEVENNINKIIK